MKLFFIILSSCFFLVYCLHRKTLEDDKPFYTTEPEHKQLISRGELCQESGGVWRDGSCSKTYSYLANKRRCQKQSNLFVWDGDGCVEKSKALNFYRYCVESADAELRKFFSKLQSSIGENNCQSMYLNLKNRKSLILEYGSLTNISPLKNFENLEMLSLKGNLVIDISSVSKMKKLKYLNLDKNLVNDISVLSSLRNLEQISLRENPVFDLKPLERLVKIKEIYVDFDTSKNINADKIICPDLPKSKALSDLCMQISRRTN